MPAASGNRIPTSTAVHCRAQPETPESSEPPHLGAPALAPECTGTAPPGGHRRRITSQSTTDTKKNQYDI
ncbi:hypothetical protein JOQ06_012904 [Pogonophryne albipinna]|uniref:Uncharacterized protein n=1 Tax=Pogonophryne albipinna TaxID=1090488 RepID=A0AAD6FSL9_9TELE|nr:hypothetical protein JOQ06_012904 [Pogonophryne albipinna]